jgi:DMSO/TMAO reductase YedYZ molybdopterin-dependent catalytic subunit
MATLYGGAQLFGLTFAPFALVDWLARVAPGALITLFIDSMVAVLQTFSVDDLSATAKLTEQAFGVATVAIFMTSIATAICRRPWRRRIPLATGSGFLVGAALAWVISRVGGQGGPAGAAWTIAIFTAWGAVVDWVRVRLSRSLETDGALPSAVRTSRIDRRRFLVTLGGASAVVTVMGAATGIAIGARRRTILAARAGDTWSATHDLPNAGAAVVPVAGTRPEFTSLDDHYRIDINTRPPRVDGETWRLRVHGLVRRPLELTLDDIRSRPATHQFVTLACISNPVAGSLIGTTRWSGVPLKHVIEEAQPESGASHVRLRSADGFDEVVALDLARMDDRVMLTYDWDGVPLQPEHGYPLRIYIPDRYGMKQPKWIEEIEVIHGWQPGYWVRRGWDREARMEATSVIDVVATDALQTSGRPDVTVPIGGIAHAGALGISRVEVRVDDEGWQAAELREPLSKTTWVIWRYDWPFSPGPHTFTVRCVDGAGRAQVEAPSPPAPDGATGLHDRRVEL